MRIRFYPVRFWLFFCVHDRFRPINWGNQRYTYRNQFTVSPRGTQLKNPLLHRRSSSFCPRCIIRRKIIWSCPSFESRPIFGFGATSDFLDQILAMVGINSNCAGRQADFCVGYLSESRWTNSEKRTADSVALRALNVHDWPKSQNRILKNRTA